MNLRTILCQYSAHKAPGMVYFFCPNAASPPLFSICHIPICVIYQCVSYTSMFHIPVCVIYQYVSYTSMCHIPVCVIYQYVSYNSICHIPIYTHANFSTIQKQGPITFKFYISADNMYNEFEISLILSKTYYKPTNSY